MDIQFNNLDNVLWLWAVLGAGLLLLMAARLRTRALRRFAGPLAGTLTSSSSPTRRRLRPWLMLATLLLIVVAMIDPRWGVRYQELQRRGVDVFFVLDTSRSMHAEDVKPNRLTRAKQYIEDVLESLGGDRVGLVTAAGDPTVTVLTLDYGAMRLRSMRRGSRPDGEAALCLATASGWQAIHSPMKSRITRRSSS